MPHREGAATGRARGATRGQNLETVGYVLGLFSPWPVIVGRGPRALGAAMRRQGGGGLHFSILFMRPVKGDRAMRRTKIVLVSGRCRRDDRHIGACRQPAPYYWPGARRRAGDIRERNPHYGQRAHKPPPPRLPGRVGVSRTDRPRQRSPPCARLLVSRSAHFTMPTPARTGVTSDYPKTGKGGRNNSY